MLNQGIYSSALWLLLLGAPALAVELSLQKCPRHMTAVDSLQFQNYSGTWYMQMMYPNLVENPYTCSYHVMSKKDDGRMFVRKVQVNTITHTLSQRTLSVLKWHGNRGHYVLERGLMIFVLDTDYANYAIEYSCIEAEGYMRIEWAAIKTRMRAPTAETMYTARNLATAHGLQLGHMISIMQLGCPK